MCKHCVACYDSCDCAYCVTLCAGVAAVERDGSKPCECRKDGIPDERRSTGPTTADVAIVAESVHNAAREEDWETAHSYEDGLAGDFIEALATGQYKSLHEAKRVAAEIFELLNEERTRWYA